MSASQAISIFDKVGLGAIFEFLSSASVKVQSLIMCLIGIVISPNVRSSSTSRAVGGKVCQYKENGSNYQLLLLEFENRRKLHYKLELLTLSHKKDTLSKIIKQSDSNSALCRSKSFLILYFIFNIQPELLQPACKSKLISSVERESKVSFVFFY